MLDYRSDYRNETVETNLHELSLCVYVLGVCLIKAYFVKDISGRSLSMPGLERFLR